jgi:hypothetical protein
MTTPRPRTRSHRRIMASYRPPEGMPAPIGQPVMPPLVGPVNLLPIGQRGGGGGPADCPT